MKLVQFMAAQILALNSSSSFSTECSSVFQPSLLARYGFALRTAMMLCTATENEHCGGSLKLGSVGI